MSTETKHDDRLDEVGRRGDSHDQLLTYEQAAQYLGLSYSRIADLVYKGILHPVPPPPNYPNRKLKLLKLSELQWYNTQRPSPKPTLTLADIGIAPGDMGMISYEQAAQYLGQSSDDLAKLVSAGELHPDARNRLRADEIAWYDRKRNGKDAGENPYLQTEQALAQREAEEASQSEPLDTLAALRAYVEQHMAGSETARILNAAITEVAQHIVGALVRDTPGMEPLPEADRTRLDALLGALTQKGR